MPFLEAHTEKGKPILADNLDGQLPSKMLTYLGCTVLNITQDKILEHINKEFPGCDLRTRPDHHQIVYKTETDASTKQVYFLVFAVIMEMNVA